MRWVLLSVIVPAILQKLGFKGFQRGDDAQMAELTTWLGI